MSEERELSDIELLALNKLKCGDPDSIRERVKPGEYPVDVRVSISGMLKVGEDYGMSPPVKAPTALALAMVISEIENDVVREAVKQAIWNNLVSALNRAGRLSEEKADQILAETGIAQAEVLHIAKIKKATPEKPCKGKVSCTVVVELNQDN